ncbi:hypothetical protein [Xylophilus sp. ASV27]|uniref:hypothetical protein n=1 Tax=Xylophilus sp. ASV27 TaxID=2795129 RepID=UPI0018EBD472|nr:hypothetical protein [Xylophilus sp. ASV27]
MPDAHVEPIADRHKKPDPIRPDWISKTLAGLLLGLCLALTCSALLAALLTAMPLAVSGQLVMWLVPPVWLCVLSGVYFFSSGLRAWAWLAGANALALGLWWLQRPGGVA